MAREAYKRQVKLMLDVLPIVAKETCFALHGGTAINLFVRDMPRLSVDIDLTYVPIEDRETSFRNIAKALANIKSGIEKAIPHVHVANRSDIGKLLISLHGQDVKLEANLVIRGTLSTPTKLELCEKAQNEFDSFCEISTVPLGQLYGGKICAALDRQHPRDLFDVKYLLENEGFSAEVKEGFLLCLLSSDRPINEILFPHLLDQRSAMDNQFAGMSNEAFTYIEYEQVREELIKIVQGSLTDEDKRFLLNFKNVEPDWSVYNFEAFPAVKWKLRNLQKLKEQNAKKHQQLHNILKGKLKAF